MKEDNQILDTVYLIGNTIKLATSAIITANMIAIYVAPILILNAKALILFIIITLPFFIIKAHIISKEIADKLYKDFHGAFMKIKTCLRGVK